MPPTNLELELQAENATLREKLAASEERVRALEEGLRPISTGYEKALNRLQQRAIKFERRPSDKAPQTDGEKWEDIAFWIYTDLAEVCEQARTLLAEKGEGQ